ncbi:carbohydrate ABC transporter permease [bacterium]|nr:carbohydrate ABC transporter permease [bacterium]
MALVSKIGRKSFKVRLLFIVVYSVLIGGGITMIYPFLMMLSNSTTSNADWKDFRLVPKYFFNEKEQFRKIIVEAENEDNYPYLFGHNEWFGAEDIKLYELKPLFKRNTNQVANIAADWKEFMPQIEERYIRPYFNWQDKKSFTPFVNCIPYQNFLRQKYSNDIFKLNHIHGTYYNKFDDIWQLHDTFWRRLWTVPNTPQWHDWLEWKSKLPPLECYPYPMEIEWWKYLRYFYISVDRFNEKQGTSFKSLIDVHLEDAINKKLVPQQQIENFVFEKCNSMYYVLHANTNSWNNFLKKNYDLLHSRMRPKSLAKYIEMYPPVERVPTNMQHYSLWTRYINEKELIDDVPHYKRKFGEVEVWSPVAEYRKFLKKKYNNNIKKLNEAYGPTFLLGRNFSSFDEIQMLPVPELLYHYFITNQKNIFHTFIFGNYKTVINYIAVHGRALWNTLIFIILCVGGTLIVNPMAAYALSRYRLSYSNKILIFFLATMAFPVEVGMIPNFLMIRNLGMLNTFAALVLPGLANGFSIFLLKGFFDSLPPELYEAALIDGASEFKMFYKITLPLCKPIMAVMALGAFTGAYGAFMFAFLVCQDKSMWTLMVFLYQFQQEYGNFMIMASLILSAIPTLIMFILCQRIILRGIIIPTFK